MSTPTSTIPTTTPAAAGPAPSSTHASATVAAFGGVRRVPQPVNDPNRSYAPGSPERAELKARLKAMAAEKLDIPLVIGGREIRTGRTATVGDAARPRARARRVPPGRAGARRSRRSPPRPRRAASGEAGRGKIARPCILRAAELLATTWRSTINAATMLGQSKTAFQAEIDAASEMIDFWRFNAYFAQELYGEQPISGPGVWNQMEYRPLEGFVYAISPFNFTAIGGNLTTAPALMGNTVIWKPASSAMLSGYYTLKLLEAAGLPPGVINFIPGDARQISNQLLDSPELAGVHFTGSTEVFNGMWKKIGENIGRYRALSAPGRRNRRQGLHRRPSVGRSGGSRGRDRARRLRVPGAEVLGGQPRLRAAIALERRPRSHGRDDEGDQGRRRRRLPQLHGCGDRQEGLHEDQRIPGRREAEREDPVGRHRQGRRRLLHRADADRDRRSGLPHACARRSSDRSSPRTSTPTTQWEETLRSSIARRRTR